MSTNEPVIHELPSHCAHCGVYLQGGATIHLETCPWYPISYHALMKDKERTKPTFILDLPAWDAGFEAGFADTRRVLDLSEGNERLIACPYPVQSRESLSWHAGYIEGKVSRQDLH